MTKHLYNIEGLVKRHPDGFGFLLPDDKSKKDVFLPKHTMEGIMSNDRVSVKVFIDQRTNEIYGEILKVVQRFTSNVIGIYHSHNNTHGIILDKENHWGQNLKIEINKALNAKENEWVEVKVLTYPGHPAGFTGEVVQVIGHRNDPMFDTKRAIALHSIPEGFSKDTEKEIKSLKPSIEIEGQEHRKDLRDTPFVTIDGVTAKDFDDAIHVETTDRGFNLKVAIADVSHYVKPKTALDKDAYNKGNSSYFPMYVVPMLPEILSNELCSLKPRVDRFALVCEMLIDFKGELLKYDFYEAIINSHARITYGEAQEIVDGFSPEAFRHVEDHVKKASDLAKILMNRRYTQGSLSLEIPETQVILDESGTPVDIIKSERVFSHKLIEEMMLIANVAVARFFEDKELNGIYRVHSDPDPEKLNVLERFLKSFGTQVSLEGGKLQKRITKSLKKYAGKPEEKILAQLTLRSMKQAQYSGENDGHFGLAFDHYTHFTSPIRRYPDLIVHRVIKAHLYGPKRGYWAPSIEEIDTAATHCSATEQRSVKAERFLISVKKARFAQKLVGEEFEGRIASVTKFGVFVSLREYDIEGLVRIDELGNDYFIFDEESLSLRGERSGYTYKMGQEVTVLVAAANHELGQIDFQLKSNAFTPAKSKPKAYARKKKKAEKARREKPRGKKESSSRGKKKKSKSKAKKERPGIKKSQSRKRTKKKQK